MKNCPQCSFGNKDAAHFCVKCGAPLDKRCPQCGSITEEGEIFCSVCGARLDGKKVCPNCKTVNDPENRFCESCGTPLGETLGGNAPASAPSREQSPAMPAAVPTAAPMAATTAKKKPKRDKKQLYERILSIVRASVTLAMALIMFIASFFAAGKIDLATQMSELDFPPMGSMKVTTVDIIEGAIAWSDPMSMEEMEGDFIAYMADHLSDREMEILQDMDSYRAISLIRETIEGYNVLKLVAIDEFVEYAPSAVMELWFAAIFCLAYIGLCTAFLAVSAVDFAYALLGKKRMKAPFRLNMLVLAFLFFLTFLMRMVLAPSWNMGAGMITVLVCGILAFAAELVYKILNGDLKFEKAKIPTYISAGVGAAVSLVVLFLGSASVLGMTCTMGDSVFSAGYNCSALAGACGTAMYAADNPDLNLYGSALEQITQIFGYYYDESDLLMSSGLSPANMGVLGNSQIENVLSLIGILLDIFCFAFLAAAALQFVNGFRSFANDKKTSLLYPILTLALAVVVLALSIVYMALVNQTMEGFEGITYSVRLAAPVIATAVLAVINLVQRIVCGALTRKAQNAEGPVSE